MWRILMVIMSCVNCIGLDVCDSMALSCQGSRSYDDAHYFYKPSKESNHYPLTMLVN